MQQKVVTLPYIPTGERPAEALRFGDLIPLFGMSNYSQRIQECENLGIRYCADEKEFSLRIIRNAQISALPTIMSFGALAYILLR